MRLILCGSLLLLATFLRAGEQPAPKSEEEQKKLQGVWLFTAIEQNGVKLGKDQLADGKWVFEGNNSTLKFGTTVQESKLTLDPSKDPRQINLAVNAGPDKGKTYRGIYKFVDDELIICFPGDTKAERPKEFSGNVGNGQALYVLKKKGK